MEVLVGNHVGHAKLIDEVATWWYFQKQYANRSKGMTIIRPGPSLLLEKMGQLIISASIAVID